MWKELLLNGFSSGREKVNGGSAEGLDVAWIIALRRTLALSRSWGRKYKQGSQRVHVLVQGATSLQFCWSPQKPAGVKPQVVEMERVCHVGTAMEKA